MRELANFLVGAAERGQRILVLCHHNADPDAVASAIVLTEVLNRLSARAQAGVSESLNLISQNLLRAFGREIVINPSLEADLVVLVDTSSLKHLGKLGEQLEQKAPKLVVVDHHRPVEAMKQLASFYLVREESASESELILQLAQELSAELTPEEASLLLAGIISDTAHFRLAKGQTFEAVNFLIKVGADYRRVLEALRLPEDLPKRVAMLKAAQRVELRRVHGRLVVFSELGSFEGDAASMLVRIGADVALVGSEEKDRMRVSGRARQKILKTTRLHLGELMEELGKQFGGNGGGHAGAASMNGKGKLDEAKKYLFKALQQKLKPKE
jgi:nanoRNase/pAp phosphatase (c-di-AMP/oligoRNAs hydrolase)